ncbi:SH3 domain-containing protein [Bacillus cytotoxicus]
MIFLLTKTAKFTFPFTPKGTGPKGGDAKTEELNTLGQGVIPFSDGKELEEVSFTSFFSFKKVSGEEARHDPFSAVSFLSSLRDSQEVVLLNLPDLNYKREMKVKKFEYWQDSPGYIEFTITFKEHREIKLGYMDKSGVIRRPPANNLNKYALQTGRVNGTHMLAIRQGPSSNSRVIGTIKQGQVVTFSKNTKTQAGWLYIQYGSLHGYVAAQFIQ